MYAQNVFPSMHAPWMHTKHIHIACAQLAPFCTYVCKMCAFVHTILAGEQNVISVYACMLLSHYL